MSKNKTIQKIFVYSLIALFSIVLSSCEDEFGDGGNTSRGSVKVTSVTKGNKVNGHYKVTVSVSATGINASDVESIGFYYGKNDSSCPNHGRQSSGTLSMSKSIDCYTGTYYFKAFLKENGKSRIWSSGTKSIRIS